jgi:hypothetical protein
MGTDILRLLNLRLEVGRKIVLLVGVTEGVGDKDFMFFGDSLLGDSSGFTGDMGFVVDVVTTLEAVHANNLLWYEELYKFYFYEN